ncbi:hypothetical protein GUJ93_ZPchr0009g1970 [Zizania palustris]|uniref:Uncharacterized protein n=1 Tax=Zizania palustris TaxID=103762 RepID=A0A8J5VMW8_ZIZPA|nr:hypothetical protein GUJ93_ZPchr0009g1970 [Zizania palustris]
MIRPFAARYATSSLTVCAQRNHSPAFFSGAPSSFAAYPSLHALFNVLPSLIRPAASIPILLYAHGNDELAFEIDKNLVEASLADIEPACKQKVVFGNLKNGNAALKSIPSEINIDDVQKLMDGTTEAKAYQDWKNVAPTHLMGELTNTTELLLVQIRTLAKDVRARNTPN